MQTLDSLDSIANLYDAILCDVWGVVHNGRRVYEPACAALARFRAKGGAVILITNVPKPRGPIPGQLDRLGAPRDAWDAIVTSGDAIRVELERRAPGPMYKIGPPHDAPLWEGLGLQQSDMQNAAFVAVSGLNNDGVETPEDYKETLGAARARDLELICANPDIVVRVGDQSVWCAGALARDYAMLGGRVVLAGKPHAPIYNLALHELAGRAIDKNRMLAIGDGIPTDVRGANEQGIDCLFIAGGMHGQSLLTDGGIDPAKIGTAFATEGVHARYAMVELA